MSQTRSFRATLALMAHLRRPDVGRVQMPFTHSAIEFSMS
jgi:hypothetical protein